MRRSLLWRQVSTECAKTWGRGAVLSQLGGPVSTLGAVEVEEGREKRPRGTAAPRGGGLSAARCSQLLCSSSPLFLAQGLRLAACGLRALRPHAWHAPRLTHPIIPILLLLFLSDLFSRRLASPWRRLGEGLGRPVRSGACASGGRRSADPDALDRRGLKDQRPSCRG